MTSSKVEGQPAAGGQDQPKEPQPRRRKRQSAADVSRKFAAAAAAPQSDEFDDYDEPDEEISPRDLGRSLAPHDPETQPASGSVKDEDRDDSDPYPTGIEIDADLHEKVQRRCGGGRKRDVQQTEVLLTAFETVHGEIPDLVKTYKSRHNAESSLFGTRPKRVAETSGPAKRLQVRPRWGEYKVLKGLADEQAIPLAQLTRLVLRRFFEKEAPTAKSRRSDA